MESLIQRSFAGGEISPALYARADQVKYATGLKTCRNFLVMRHGGVANRSGTKLIAEHKFHSKKIRMIPFVFNADQTYVLEFGDQYMRVIRYGVQLTNATKNIVGITQANPGVVNVTAHGYATGTEIYIKDIIGPTDLNGRNFKVVSVDANNFSLTDVYGTPISTLTMPTYVSGGTVASIYEIATPYLEADLPRLQYAQSADIVTLTHTGYQTRQLARTGHTSWTMTTEVFAPQSVPVPGAVTVVAPGAAAITWKYVITALDAETYEESLPSAVGSDNGDVPSLTAPIVITWTAVTPTPAEYAVYRETWPGSGIYAYLGAAAAIGSPTFKDPNIVPDKSVTIPIARDPFNGSGNWPATSTFYQQRRLFGQTTNKPTTVWASKTGNYKNFTISSPLQPTDAVTWSHVGRQVHEVRHLVEMGKLLVFTSGGEWTIEGDASGALSIEINPRLHGTNGSAVYPAPLIVNSTVLYVQARGSIIRDLRFDLATDGYSGRDLTVFSSHLFENKTIIDWCYQQIPHSIIWTVRDDGTLAALTYMREQEVWGWHRHDTNGKIEAICSVPEGDEDYVYLSVQRTLQNGQIRRYIERMPSRIISDLAQDAFFVDCGLTYDGRNTTATTMTLSGGTNWLNTETLTLTASAPFFSSADVGNAIVLQNAGDEITLTIYEYTSTTVVTGRANKTVPTAFRTTALATWGKAVNQIGNLWHLEGMTLNVLADGSVYRDAIVSNGKISIGRPHVIIHAGLEYLSDFETLDIDQLQGKTLSNLKKNIKEVTLHVENTRGIWAGEDADHLMEWAQREFEPMGVPPTPLTGRAEIPITSSWSDGGRVFVRQRDPLPITILAAIPGGEIGG